MNELFENISITADKIIDCNLINDISEQKVIDSVNEDEIFVYTITKPCPTSFLTCC